MDFIKILELIIKGGFAMNLLPLTQQLSLLSLLPIALQDSQHEQLTKSDVREFTKGHKVNCVMVEWTPLSARAQ